VQSVVFPDEGFGSLPNASGLLPVFWEGASFDELHGGGVIPNVHQPPGLISKVIVLSPPVGMLTLLSQLLVLSLSGDTEHVNCPKRSWGRVFRLPELFRWGGSCGFNQLFHRRPDSCKGILVNTLP